MTSNTNNEILVTQEKKVKSEENDEEVKVEEVHVATVKTQELNSADELRLINSVTDREGNRRPSEWYKEYFQKYVKSVEIEEEGMKILEEDQGDLDHVKDSYSGAEVLNSSHGMLKTVTRTVMAEVPNLKVVLGRNGKE